MPPFLNTWAYYNCFCSIQLRDACAVDAIGRKVSGKTPFGSCCQVTERCAGEKSKCPGRRHHCAFAHINLAGGYFAGRCPQTTRHDRLRRHPAQATVVRASCQWASQYGSDNVKEKINQGCLLLSPITCSFKSGRSLSSAGCCIGCRR